MITSSIRITPENRRLVDERNIPSKYIGGDEIVELRKF
jgi:hypothetical protein